VALVGYPVVPNLPFWGGLLKFPYLGKVPLGYLLLTKPRKASNLGGGRGFSWWLLLPFFLFSQFKKFFNFHLFTFGRFVLYPL